MDYSFEHDDADALIARLGPHFTPFIDPMDVQIPLSRDPVWGYLRVDLQLVGNRLLRLELEEDERNSPRVTLVEMQPFGEPRGRLERPGPEEMKLWSAVVVHPQLPPSMEVLVRDLLLTTGADASPANAERIVELYQAVAEGPDDELYVGLAILRANTIARSRKMPVEDLVRIEILALAERSLTTTILPGIALRHAAAIAEAPRVGARALDEVIKVGTILDHIEDKHRDESTADWVAQCRLALADSEAEREAAQRRHVEQFIAISDDDAVPFRAMIWAEKAVALASNYGIQDLHDIAVVKMQKLSRTDLGWHRHTADVNIPVAVIRQRERRVMKLSSWEQGLSNFLAQNSPSGPSLGNRTQAAGIRRGLLELVSGRTFGSHQLPERTHGPAEIENLNRIVQSNLDAAAMTLRIDLAAISSRFGVPDEDLVVAYLSTIYGSAPELVRPFAESLRLYWQGDASSSARLAIPLVEAGARELLFLMDQPLYRMERGASPGRFPAMDFYLEKLEQVGLDPDWTTALRGTLLSGGKNLRNRLAHGFQLDFSFEEAALALRLAGLFIAMPVGSDAINDERVTTPLKLPRSHLRRHLGWVWR